MHYLNISFTHKNSTMEIREKLSYPDEDSQKGCLERLLSCESISEAILISTCNRIEVLCNCKDVPIATNHIFEMLSRRSGISIDELEGRADIFDDSSAIHHLFSVASSLDSMVLGETQIVGQLKDAFRFAYDNHFCGKKLARAMKSAFKTAAKVRNATDISAKPVSMASVAVNKLKSLVNDLSGKKALIIGVGEMSEITAKHLVSTGVNVTIMNRTLHKAEALAKECSAEVLPFSDLKSAINEYEILFSATSAYEPIITSDFIESKEFDRYWFDLALPRDISYDKGERIHLYVIDDLKLIVDENISARENAARAAHSIIGRGVVEFFEWLNTQDIELVIKEIYAKANKAASDEAGRAIKNGYIPKEYAEESQKMCEQALKRFLHEFTVNMRTSSEDTQAEMLRGAMNSIMKIRDEE
ncbi:MAG: glutamyl-tRNA reductase [Campylobacterales bacterium]|nr:glutamyl-tRNA reductase [Campylobacterales bacterium]